MKFSSIPFPQLVVCLLLTAVYFCISGLGAEDKAAITQERVVALVKRTVADMAVDAPGTLAKINKAVPPYQDPTNPALYTMAYDTDAVLCGHPRPDLQGKSMKGEPDVEGKKFRDEIVATALAKKSAWVDYAYQKPGSPGIFQKTAYCEVVKGSDGKTYIVCSGMYKAGMYCL